MRFHVVGLPHAKTTRDFETCAFTEKVRKFCKMMKAEGHWVHLYSAGDANEAPCDFWTSCLSEEDRLESLGGQHFIHASFDNTKPHWQKFNAKVIDTLARDNNLRPYDFICVIGGSAHKPIADACTGNMTVEFGIGYEGTFSDFRVFESYAWMHAVYGHDAACKKQRLGGSQEHWFDAVIPSYFEPELFPFSKRAKDHYLYIGRLTDRKGWRIAQLVCEKLNKRLIVAGPGDDFTGYGEYVGVADAKLRGELMSGAIAQFTPTIYIEPFGSVACEAQMCGTPVITTDWGAFTETVTNGVSGYRCRYLGEFIHAARNVKHLDRAWIRKRAMDRWSLGAVAPQYTRYFERLSLLFKEPGWYDEAPPG